jgi:DNA-cytosine methyltransferase
MKYYSFFTGIGGFEYALYKKYPNAECLGYSEIKPEAIKVYQHHYPEHKNMGDIINIKDLPEKADIIFGGFPCTNLSSMANIKGNNKGLEGPKSRLFYDFLRLLKIAKTRNENVMVILENNASMSIKNRELITKHIKDIFPNINLTLINSSSFGVQHRKRLFWTNFPIEEPKYNPTQTWKDVLDPFDKRLKRIIGKESTMIYMNKGASVIKNDRMVVYAKYNGDLTYNGVDFAHFKMVEGQTWNKKLNRIFMGRFSDTTKTNIEHGIQIYPYPNHARPLLGSDNVIIDRFKDNTFILRKYTRNEMERLMGFSDGWTDVVSLTKSQGLLGNSVVTTVVQYIINYTSNQI